MYADDLLIMSPSLVGLQHMLDTCSQYAAKTACVAVGKDCRFQVMYMFILLVKLHHGSPVLSILVLF